MNTWVKCTLVELISCWMFGLYRCDVWCVREKESVCVCVCGEGREWDCSGVLRCEVRTRGLTKSEFSAQRLLGLFLTYFQRWWSALSAQTSERSSGLDVRSGYCRLCDDDVSSTAAMLAGQRVPPAPLPYLHLPPSSSYMSHYYRYLDVVACWHTS